MNDIKVKILQHGYQRNGIGGEGFYYFIISWIDDENEKQEGVATLKNHCDKNDENPEKFNGSCRVVTPSNLDNHWRGDVFEIAIRKQYKTWYS